MTIAKKKQNNNNKMKTIPVSIYINLDMLSLHNLM